jgi:hypothetical protein
MTCNRCLVYRGPCYRFGIGLAPNVTRVARFHLPLKREIELAIRKKQSTRLQQERTAQINMTAEEFVEDAGLEDDISVSDLAVSRKGKKKAA